MIANSERSKKADPKSPKSQLTLEETKELGVVLQPMKDLIQQMSPTFNSLAFVTPNLLPG